VVPQDVGAAVAVVVAGVADLPIIVCGADKPDIEISDRLSGRGGRDGVAPIPTAVCV
jgi:hypothetical protein